MTTQAELIASVAKDAGVSQADAGRMLDALVKNIHKSLTGGGDVRISNLGVFDTAARTAREGRTTAAGSTIKFAPSKALRGRASKPPKTVVDVLPERAAAGDLRPEDWLEANLVDLQREAQERMGSLDETLAYVRDRVRQIGV